MKTNLYSVMESSSSWILWTDDQLETNTSTQLTTIIPINEYFMGSASGKENTRSRLKFQLQGTRKKCQ